MTLLYLRCLVFCRYGLHHLGMPAGLCWYAGALLLLAKSASALSVVLQFGEGRLPVKRARVFQ